LPVQSLKESGSNPEQPGARSPYRVFHSVLFGETPNNTPASGGEVPDYFSDLNLDQIVEAVTAGRDEYNLKPFFYQPLVSIDQIRDRQIVFRDLECEPLLNSIRSFAAAMREMRSRIAHVEKFYYAYQKQALFLDAVAIYHDALSQLATGLASRDVGSLGLQAFRDYLTAYVRSRSFRELSIEAAELRSDLNCIQYSLQIHGRRITVATCGDEADFSLEVLRTFERFRQGASKNYQFRISSWPEMNHIEAAIVERVARLYPEVFARLEDFPKQHSDYLDDVIARFDREVQFFVAYIEFRRKIESAGLRFCYPAVSSSKEVHCNDTFDLALAMKLVEAQRAVVTNSFYLRGQERVLVISGPNQGGKTTFARAFGQLHHLGCLGCPVPGAEAKLFLFDRLYTHFERQEDLRNLSGKLEDELNRIHSVLGRATGDSILIMNESFRSTTLNDALFLSKEIMSRIMALGMLCVTVTFLDELSALGAATVSMVSTIDPKDPAIRTFKIIRKPADGRAYAAAIAEKYQLTADAIMGRIAANAKEGHPS
jgi:DNA mismatch repair protein MutS